MSNGSERTPERTWLQPGDRVRLTGEDWIHLGLHGQTVRVVDIDLDGDPLIEDPNGGVLAVYTKPEEGIDYSAERVDTSPLEVPAPTSSETGSDLKLAEDDPWEGFTGESPEEAAYAEGWKDAREHDTFGALRDRVVALEAVIAAARSAAQPTPNGEPLRERIIAVLDLAPSTVLDGMIREAKAEAVEAFSRELLERYPADVFRSLSDADHKSVNDALAGRAQRTHVTRDAISADMMRRAAAQARDYATEIRKGDA